ncbi:MAG: adenosine kinase [Bacteriovoracales bacterium]|nr:adenosine kinase [Bacteriovoracales bacterium]
MDHYHIYGMGNALLDREFEVSDEFLEEMGIDKGHMTLIDGERKKELLKKLGASKNVACGGSTANSLIAATQWGAKAFCSCKVSDDGDGRLFRDDLKARGVDFWAEWEEEGQTGNCLVMVTSDAQRSMNTYLGISADYSRKEIHEAALKNSEYLLMEGYLVASPTAREAMMVSKKMAEANGVKTVLALSDINMVEQFHGELGQIIGDGVDIIFANEEEVKAFTGERDLNRAIASLRLLSSVAAVTQGPKGAIVDDGRQSLEVPSISIDPVDSNGAGDMFAGVFLSALAKRGGSLEKAARLACLCAARVVEKWGPRFDEDDLGSVTDEARSLGLIS